MAETKPNWIKALVRITGEHRGTGCFVGPRLVLTALHVVSNAYLENRQTRSHPNVIVAGRKAKLLWPIVPIAKDCLDVALVETQGDEFGTPLEVNATWNHGAQFEAPGFLPGDREGLVYPRGVLLSHGEREDRGRVECSSGHQPDQGVDWRGISGAPVIVDGRVCGVIIERKPKWKACLDALPLRLLMDNDGFLEHLPSLARDRQFDGRLLEMLEQDKALLLALSRATSKSESVVLKVFFQEPVESLLELIQRAHSAAVAKLLTNPNPKMRRLAESLFLLARLLVASRCPFGERTTWGGHAVAAYTRTGLEFGAARYQGRAIELDAVTHDNAFPGGKFRLPFAPDKGRPDKGYMERQLNKKVAPPEGAPRDWMSIFLPRLRKQGFSWYFGGDEDRVAGCEQELTDFIREYPDLPIIVARKSRANVVDFEPSVLPIIVAIHREHQRLPPS